LLRKLLNWVEVYVETDAEQKRLARWKRDNAAVLDYAKQVLPEVFYEESDDDDDSGLEDENIPLEFPRESYKIDEILEDCFNDLHQLSDFLNELRKFKPSNDDKLRRLSELLKKDLKDKKVLIFTQFSDTAKYLQNQLNADGF